MRYLALLRRPIPLLLWIGQLTSMAGDRLYAMALLWLTLEVTGSTTTTAVVGVAESLTLALVGFIGGAFVDRLHQTRLMIALDLARALLLLLLPVVATISTLQAWQFALLGILMGGLGALFDPALQATLPRAVSEAEFPALAGLMDTPGRFARLFGPGLAGLLLTVMKVQDFFTLDAVTFLVSALCLLLVSRSLGRAPRSTPRERSVAADLKAGLRLVRGQPNVALIIASDGVGNLAFPAFNLGGMLLSEATWQAGAGGYGLIIAAYGVGSLLGNMAIGNASGYRNHSLLAKAGWLGIGLGFIGMGFAPSLPWGLAASAIAGAAGSIAHVSRAVYFRQVIPGGDLGKVYGLQRAITTLSAGAGLLLCGLLLDRLAAGSVVALAGALMIVSALLILSSRPVRDELAA